MKTKKIINVLKFIKKHCKSNDNCKHCIFVDKEGFCSLSKPRSNVIPQEWDIKALKNKLKSIGGIIE